MGFFGLFESDEEINERRNAYYTAVANAIRDGYFDTVEVDLYDDSDTNYKYTKEEARFCFSVAVIMMLIDGKSDQSELDVIANPPDFRTLTKMYDAIKDKNDELYFEVADTVARADGILEDAEKVFMYKLQLLFSGITEKPVYKITADNRELAYTSKKYPVITYLAPEMVKQRYPKTGISYNDFYVQYPADPESLMAIKDILSPNFVHDKDTEILEAMRVAGASTVYIKVTENTITEHQFKTELNASANILRTIDIGGGCKLDLSDSYDKNKNEIKAVTFSGGEPPLPQEKDLFIKASRWVIHDSHLNWLLNARFSTNPIKEFYWEVEYKDVVSELMSANIAIKCGLVKVSADASVSVDTAIKK